MKTILAIETSTDACSAALWRGDACIEEYVVAPRQHAQLILQQIDNVLSEAGVTLTALDGIAFSRGPGSFTGIRMACSVAQGLALGADLPLIPISTLRALAQKTVRDFTHCLPMFVARLDEVYWGSYARDPHGLMQAVLEDQLTVIGAVHYLTESFAAVGGGWDIFEAQNRAWPEKAIKLDLHYPSAREVGFLALSEPVQNHRAPESIEAFLPAYLRADVASVRG